MSTIAVGADHAGFALKEKLKRLLVNNGWRVDDVTPLLNDGDDYPPIARAVSKLVLEDAAQFGFLVCGAGFGMEIAANRFHGIRAVAPHTAREAKLSREHNHANVLVLGGRTMTFAQTQNIMRSWLKSKPSKAVRHMRRVRQLDET